MTSRSYTRSRLMVLASTASVVEAARAMEANDIGTVIVQDAGRVAGLPTDRDVALRVMLRSRLQAPAGPDRQVTRKSIEAELVRGQISEEMRSLPGMMRAGK